MQFTAICFRSEEILSRETAESFFVARDIARTRLATQRVRSGATHVEVHSQDGAVFFDSRSEMAVPAGKRPGLAANLIKRLSPQKALGSL